MQSDEEFHEEQIVFCDDGGRPEIVPYKGEHALFPNDDVWIVNPQREGIFRVKDADKNTYRLLDKDGKLVDDGKWFKESDLKLKE